MMPMRTLALLALLAAPSACSSDAPSSTDGGLAAAPDLNLGPPHGVVAADGSGGSVNLLSFTAFGDVRPPIPDDDFQYPTTVITGVMQGMAALDPEFAVGTGDYMFVELLGASANDQIDKLLGAEKSFPKPIFHGLGNHECNSFTDVNCPNLDESPNIKAYLQRLAPSGSQTPWFSFVVHTALGDAKFLFVAVNAWNDAQAAWLTDAVKMPTKYTFVVRHHPTPDAGKASSAEGKLASDKILAGTPVTLFLFGHVHEYLHVATNAVIAGNAGAPLDMGHYGWVHVLQRSDGNVSVTAYDAASGMPIDTWAVTPDGQAAP